MSLDRSTANQYATDADWNQLYVDGEWIDAGGRNVMSVTDPSTGETFTSVPAGTTDDVDAAVAAAAEAQSEWAQMPPAERAEVMADAAATFERHREELRELLTAESGSTSVKAEVELDSALGVLKESESYPTRLPGEHMQSNVPGKENVVKREPVGVVTVISPWNYPLLLSMRALAPALAVGNAVILKPASPTPISGGLAIGRLFDEAGLPDGLLNVVPGRGSDIGDRVAGHPEVDAVAFTGSTGVGRHVAAEAARNMAVPAMELGGNSPFVVLEDADLDLAVDAGVFGTYLHQGQICMSINRHLVHESVYDEYVERLAERARALPTGSAHDPETVVGPIVNESQRDEILEYVEESVGRGATLETGGGHDGLVVEPTVLSDMTNDMAAACNEHFGPVAPVIPFTTDEEAVQLANDTEYGLSAAVISESLGRAQCVANEIDAGMVHINDMTVNSESHVPFGGMKASGIGRYYGEEILHELTETKWISTQHERREYPF